MFDRTRTALVAAALFALPTFALAAVTTDTQATTGTQSTTPVEGSRNPSFAENGHYKAHKNVTHPSTGTGNVLGGATAGSTAGEGGSGAGGNSSK